MLRVCCEIVAIVFMKLDCCNRVYEARLFIIVFMLDPNIGTRSLAEFVMVMITCPFGQICSINIKKRWIFNRLFVIEFTLRFDNFYAFKIFPG